MDVVLWFAAEGVTEVLMVLVICWHLLTEDADYDDLGGDDFTRNNPDRQRDHLIAQLHGLGYRVTLDKVA